MNLDATLTVQSNQIDQFYNYYECNQLHIFLNKEMVKCIIPIDVQFQSLLEQVFYRYWLLPVA